MTLQTFINKYTGKGWDWDGAYGNQCVDLYRFYVKEVWGLPKTPGVKGAFQILDTLDRNTYEVIKYRAGLTPRIGDVVIFGQTLVKNGHVGIAAKDITLTQFTIFDQNNPEGAKSKMHTFTYKHVVGWFRPKNINNKRNSFDMHKLYKGTVYVMSLGFWLAVGTKGEEYLAEWNLSEYPPEMTKAQFDAFPVHKRTIR